MTQPVVLAGIPSQTVVSGSSRYLKQNVVYYGDQRLLTFDTYIRQTYNRRGDEKVMLVTKGTEYRPDLVSQDVYGFPDNWWRILEANGMKDIFDFKAGVTIILPNQII